MYSLIGAIVAYALNNHFLAFEPLFVAPEHSHRYALHEYALVALVAVFCSAPAGLGINVLFKKLKKLVSGVPSILRPAIGAVATAAIAVALWFGLDLEPNHVLGVGEETIKHILHGTGNPALSIWWILVVLAVAKAFATGFTLMSDGSAGMLVPAMFMGGVAGAMMFRLLTSFGMAVGPDPSLFVVAGIASALVAVIDIPLATIAFVMEVFGAHYGPPAIVACVLCYMFAKRFKLYTQQPTPSAPQEGEHQSAGS